MARKHHSVSEMVALIGSQWGKIQDGTSTAQIARFIELATAQAKEEEQQRAQEQHICASMREEIEALRHDLHVAIQRRNEYAQELAQAREEIEQLKQSEIAGTRYAEEAGRAEQLLAQFVKGDARADDHFDNEMTLDKGVTAWKLLRDARAFLAQHKE